MNKTVTVNLGGIVYHIDEVAYDLLSNYLDAIRRHFGNSEGSEEIMSDIESRFAEMFTEKLTGGRQVIQTADVEESIRIMGKPEDIAGNNEPNADHSGPKRRKRFYRNPDDKVIGGVCGGIATYFDFDPLWLRLGFAITFFVFGSGFLLYLILMIIIPKARTTAEKLEMRGERVNIPNIEKSIKEEFENFKSTFNEFKNEAKGYSRSTGPTKVRNSANQFIQFVEEVFTGLFRTIGKFLAAILLIISLVVITSLTIGFLASTGIISSVSDSHMLYFNSRSFSVERLSGMIFSSPLQLQLTALAICLVIGIPFLKLVMSSIRFLFNIKSRQPVLNISLSILWAIGLTLGIIQAYSVATLFKEEGEVRENIPVLQPKGNVLFLDADEVDDEWAGDDEMSSRFQHISIRIVKSETDSFELIKTAVSRGSNRKEASRFAENISFSFEQKDSLLRLNPWINLKQNDKFRNQRIHLLLKVPQGKSVHMSYDLENILSTSKNDEDYHPDEMLGHTWQMGEKKLSCVDC